MPGLHEIRYTTEAVQDIAALRAFDQAKVRSTIRQHLPHNPTRESRSRVKRMVQPFWSQFRLRVGDFRVYYDVDDGASVVYVLRVLRKGSQTTQQAEPT